MNYLKPEMTINVEFYGTEPVGIELPQTVDLKVIDTAPGIKGATASNQVKPATLETGLVVSVPPFINTGDLIRVSTETGEYLSRVTWISIGSCGHRDSHRSDRNHKWTSSVTSPIRAGSKSSSAACSAARARS